MNLGSALALGVFGLAALCDWTAVARGNKRLEYLCKPAAMGALVGAAALLDVSSPRRWWFVAALVLSLAGDVFLMLPRDRFVPGLGAFLGAHLAFLVGFVVEGVALAALLLALAPLGLVAGGLGTRIVKGARALDRRLGVPVGLYIGVITVMAAAGVAAELPLAAVGALSFVASDSLIGWTRFVKPLPWAPLTIMVTYHLAQFLLVLSLV